MNAAPAALSSLSLELIHEARASAAASRRRTVDVLEERLGLDAEGFVRAIAGLSRLPATPMTWLRETRPAFDLLPLNECSVRGCVPVRNASGELFLITDDPFSIEIHAWAQERIVQPFAWCLAHRGDLAAFLSSHEETLRALDAVAAEAGAGAAQPHGLENVSLKAISEETSDVVRLVRSTLRDALYAGASDIHLENANAGLLIKFRIDGVLTQAKVIQDATQAAQAVARVKVLAELDITERRLPQDGRFKALDRGRTVDFRVSIMPGIHGEDAVLRVLDKQTLYANARQQLSLDSLGFGAEDIRLLRRLSREPCGMLLVTGPTGSGKTTTLYAAITEIHSGQDKIVTIEDPVEYQLPGVLQIPVNEKKGLTFARGLRSILRHDPDKIMVGEIRDAETASIAVQSALTGHLVFTTVHANNVFDVIGRFMHMDVDLHSFVSALNGILAQRLVRLLCPHCAEEHWPEAEVLRDSGLAPGDVESFRFRVGRGCRECRGLGYKGRKAIAEMLVLNDELRELITTRAPARQFKEIARKHGTRLLRDAALAAVRSGETTLQEINRVTSVA
jgi:general secretion pathway protein E